MRYMRTSILKIFLLSVFAINILAADRMSSNDDVVAGVVIVKFSESISLTKLASERNLEPIIEKYAIQQFQPVLKNLPVLAKQSSAGNLKSVYYAYYNSQVSPFIVAEELKRSSTQIVYAEPKYLHFVSETKVEPPNDSLYQQQYHLPNVNAAEAWNITRGEMGNVVIAIVDGGTEINHPDLNANFWNNPNEIPNDGIDNDNNGFIDDIHGWNFPNDSNDPTGLPSTPINANHGTHTAGIASAVTDNSIGISGAAFNASIMAINSGSKTADNSIAYSYDGVLYAARNGADIISCSWGRSGSPSQFEQEVIDEAVANGAVVVAAAGNNNSNANYFPAQYNGVFSVAAVDQNDNKASFSNYGHRIDVSAPGVAILSTLTSKRYGTMSGTSMACPLAAGVIALVKTKNATWNGIQAAEQVRVTSENIDSKNPGFIEQLGKGRVDAFSALTIQSPSIRIAAMQYMDDDEDGIIEPGDNVNLDIEVKNFLQATTNISFELITDDPMVEILDGNTELDQLGTLQSTTLPKSLRFRVLPEAPTGHVIKFKLKITAGDYQDADYVVLIILPTFANADVNKVKVTVTNIGRIGFANIDLAETGVGFVYNDGPNLLYEGATIAGVSENQISNAARGVNVESDQDFEVANGSNLEVQTPGTRSAQESFGEFTDVNASSPLPIQVQQTTFASDDPGKDDFVLFKYRIANTSGVALKDFYFGLFFDWDLDDQNYGTNKTGYDDIRNLGYVYDTGSGPGTFTGVSLLSDQDVNFRAIYNDEAAAGNPSWGIYDGFTNDEKWQSISGGVEYIIAGPEDVSFTISAGPFNIDPYDVQIVTFAMIAGDDLASLQIHADSAQAFWAELEPLGIDDNKEEQGSPFSYQLNQNYPNPFNPETNIEFAIAKAGIVELTIYNALGEEMETLINNNLPAGKYNLNWNAGRYASGIYFYQLRAGSFIQRRKMLLLK
jgi:serine protease